MKAKIASVETFAVSYPVVGHFKFLAGRDGRPPGRDSVVVKIRDEAGRVGWGDSIPSHTWSYETLETVKPRSIVTSARPWSVRMPSTARPSNPSWIGRSPLHFPAGNRSARQASIWPCLISRDASSSSRRRSGGIASRGRDHLELDVESPHTGRNSESH